MKCKPWIWHFSLQNCSGSVHNVLCALKGTELRWQREPETQIFVENHRVSQIHPFSWNSSIGEHSKPQKTADLRRKPKNLAENRRKPQIGLCHLRSITINSALNVDFMVWAVFFSILLGPKWLLEQLIFELHRITVHLLSFARINFRL